MMAVNLLVLLDAALLAVVDVPHLLDAVVVETSRLARMIAVTVTTTVETETAPTDPAAQTIGKEGYGIILDSWTLTWLNRDRDVKEERDRDRDEGRDNGTNGEDRKGEFVLPSRSKD